MLLLMIPNEGKEGWHYLAVKKLATLLRGKTSWLFLLLELSPTENELKSHEKVCKNKNFCGILTPS